MKIEKKCWPEYFQKVVDGTKKFELRLADWEIAEGDTLVLKEWDPENKSYTGREISKVATCVVKTKGQKFWSEDDVVRHGFQVIGFK
ncbi:MAG TPA: DUF3850 domain-containing protein [Candidatus Paceibacterota bacterium]